jgi:hypothetical protein
MLFKDDYFYIVVETCFQKAEKTGFRRDTSS